MGSAIDDLGGEANQPDLGRDRGDVEGVERSVMDDDADDELLRNESQEEVRGMDDGEKDKHARQGPNLG